MRLVRKECVAIAAEQGMRNTPSLHSNSDSGGGATTLRSLRLYFARVAAECSELSGSGMNEF